MVKAIESQGVTLSVSTGSPTTFSAIGNITAIRGTGQGAGIVDITNVEDTKTRKLMDLPDEGQVSLDLNYDPDKANHIVLRNAKRNRTKLEFQIQLTDNVNTIMTFFAYVTSFALDVANDQQVKASLVLEVTGTITDDYVGWHPVGDATFDPAKKAAAVLLTGGNLIATCDGTSSLNSVLGTVFKSTGKHYCEFTVNVLLNFAAAGIGTASMSVATGNRVGFDTNGIGYQSSSGRVDNGSIGPAYGAAWTQGDVISVLVDLDASTLKFWRNGADQGTAPYSPAAATAYAPAVSVHDFSSLTANFGATAWKYTPPAGYTGWLA